MGNLKKHYIGSITSEERAARIYDRHAILTHGLRAKTNFSYNKCHVLTILDRETDILTLAEGGEEPYSLDLENMSMDGENAQI